MFAAEAGLRAPFQEASGGPEDWCSKAVGWLVGTGAVAFVGTEVLAGLRRGNRQERLFGAHQASPGCVLARK
jgi:hypothetical protein